jgi:predicted nucleic acid-binding protein
LIYLLDTNVISELREPRARQPDPSVLRWFRSVSPASLYLSVVTVMELEFGILQLERRDPARAAVLRSWLSGHVLIAFSGRILPVDIEVAQRAAALHVPTRIAELDAFIAATALVHRMTVVTRNVSHFGSSGVPTLNPWQA